MDRTVSSSSLVLDDATGSSVRLVSPTYEQRGAYLLLQEVARGGMGSIHLGRMLGAHGFSRRVAIKRLLPQYACDEQFTSMLLEEARLSASVTHPNVVSVIDIVQDDDELWLILDYVEGDSLARLMRRTSGTPVPPTHAVRILVDLLHGLAAVHEACDERGEPLGIVHRDVSPQNVMIGVDGLTRLLDFGIAKAKTSISNTRHGDVKGKLSYLAPELLRLERASVASDIYAAGLVMWEALVGRRLFDAASHRDAFLRRQDFAPPPPSSVAPWVPPELDAIVLTALAPRIEDRYESARSLLLALEAVAEPATRSEVGAWVEALKARPLLPSPATVLTPTSVPYVDDALLHEEPPAEGTRPSIPSVMPKSGGRAAWRFTLVAAAITFVLGAIGYHSASSGSALFAQVKRALGWTR